MLTFNYGSPYFWDKVVLTKLISGCHMVWDLICGTSWFYKSKTEKVTGGRMSAILPNWCCLLFITVLSGYPWFVSFPLNSYLKTILFLVKDFKEKEMAFSTERFHQKFLQKDDNKWANLVFRKLNFFKLLRFWLKLML